MSINKAFKEIGRINTERSAFDLSHNNITTANMGFLYPVLTLFTMPGDKWTIDVVSLLRAMPMVYPAYVDIMVQFDTFFVPSRLLDENFEEFISGGENNDYNVPMPKFTLDGDASQNADPMTKDNVFRRLGLVPNVYLSAGSTLNINFNNTPSTQLASCYPLRAYYFIWNEYYRDQNLQKKINFKTVTGLSSLGELSPDDGGDNIDFSNYYGGLKVAWLKDYFTSALPFQQRGTSPSIPFEALIDTTALKDNTPIGYIGVSDGAGNFQKLSHSNYFKVGDVGVTGNYNVSNNQVFVPPKNPSVPVNDYMVSVGLPGDAASYDQYFSSVSGDETKSFLSSLKVNVSDSFSISELRAAFQVQKWMERNARAGIRYTEFLQSHYNVSPSDARLDRPEYIGGAKFPLIISDVLQTSSSTQDEPLGSYAGRGVSAGFEDAVDYFVEEFGYILMLMHIRPKTSYFQGINRQLTYNDRYEYAFPEFMHLSEQGIFNSELYLSTTGDNSNSDEIFGYQGIYDELRYHPNVISGLMGREDYFSWHLARVFSTQPNLNSDFIQCNPRSDIFSITDTSLTSQFFGQIKFNIKAVRPMPIIGEPGLIDHF